MRRCAFLTMDSLEEFEAYDHLLLEPLAEVGWSVDMVSWRHPNVDWDSYRAVIIRSPWDYQEDAQRFMQVLKKIDASSAQLENPLSLVTWNIEKTYLRELEQKGVLIVPTLWGEALGGNTLYEAFDTLKAKEIVIKPTISANADDTFWIRPDLSESLKRKIEQTFNHRSFMIQPFMDKIVHEGEYSLFYFGGHYSHSILKIPKPEDFRVQEEHGGQLQSVEPPSRLLQRAKQTMAHLKPQPLYARADYVRTEEDDFALMELELIEPSLYFNMDANSPKRFARIFDHWMKENNRQGEINIDN